MKIKVVIVILAVACVGLGIAIFATKKQADDQHTTDVRSIEDYSNQVVTASKQINELGQVNLTLSNDLAAAQQQLVLSASSWRSCPTTSPPPVSRSPTPKPRWPGRRNSSPI